MWDLRECNMPEYATQISGLMNFGVHFWLGPELQSRNHVWKQLAIDWEQGKDKMTNLMRMDG